MNAAVLIVDHGSRRPDADVTVRALTEMVRALLPSNTVVEYAHMEFAEPTIADGFRRCVDAGATTIIVHPLMLAPGQHATVDIPNLVAAAAEDHPGVRYRVTAPIGADAKLAQIVVERCLGELEF